MDVANKTKPVVKIDIKVNNKDVSVNKKKMTGLEIKQAAIAEGVQIQLNFQLAILKNKKHKIVADDETVALHKGEEFRATAPDDNS